jgi:hypothetical protein
MTTIQQLIVNADRTGHQTQVVAAAAYFLGLRAQSLCCWCAEGVIGDAYRVNAGGECARCPQVGRDVILIAQS